MSFLTVALVLQKTTVVSGFSCVSMCRSRFALSHAWTGRYFWSTKSTVRAPETVMIFLASSFMLALARRSISSFMVAETKMVW